MSKEPTRQHNDANYSCPATSLGDTIPGKCICEPEISVPKKPTIHELEELLNSTNEGQVRINPDGSVEVGPSYQELESKLEAAETQLKSIAETNRIAALAVGELEGELQAIRKGHTKTVEYDLSPAMVESELRDKLIELGWKPPDQDNQANE